MKINKTIALCLMLISPLLSPMDKNYPQLSPLFPKEFSETDKDEINALFIQPSQEYREAVKRCLKEKYASTPAQKKSYQAVCRRKVEIAHKNHQLERVKEEQEKKAQEVLQQKFEEAQQRKIAAEKRQATYLIEAEKLELQQKALSEKIAIVKKANAQFKQKRVKPKQKNELTPVKLQLEGQRKLQKQFFVKDKPALLSELTRLCDDIWYKKRSHNKITGPYFDDRIHRLFGPVNEHWSYDFSPCTKKLLIKNEPYSIPTSTEICPHSCVYYTDQANASSSYDDSY